MKQYLKPGDSLTIDVDAAAQACGAVTRANLGVGREP
jgi:hypothetical protein